MAVLFLGGDAMLGRGVDQLLPHPSVPILHERHVRDARDYVSLAEGREGPIARLAAPAFVWGDALDSIRRADVRIVNLETSVTDSDAWDAGKAIHYRMHPRNVRVLSAAHIDAVTLANNHVLDWGARGLCDTIEHLTRAGIKSVGAGVDAQHAFASARIRLSDGTSLHLLALGHASSGIPERWAARIATPGVAFLPSLDPAVAKQLALRARADAGPDDLVVVSIHWGSNWGYDVTTQQQDFARQLIDAGVDVVHGHSSHHPRPIELYRGRPIFYGCGELIDDYEGIAGEESFRPDLVALVFVSWTPQAAMHIELVPMQIRCMRLVYPAPKDVAWLGRTLQRISHSFGVRIRAQSNNRLVLIPAEHKSSTATRR